MSAVVTQADREAAADLLRCHVGHLISLGCVRDAEDGHGAFVESLAHHRTEAVEELVEVLGPFEIAEAEFSDLPDTHPIAVHTTAYPVREIMLSLADFRRVRDFLSKHRGEQG